MSLSKLRFCLSSILGSARLAPLKPANRRPVLKEPDLYEPGGFHRVSLGDSLGSGKYTVLRKLGYGQYSTVWLAKDSQQQRYVALKLLRADCYGGPHDIFEREILSKVSQISTTSTNEGCHHVSPLLDQFRHTGPNGNHVCLVFDVLGHHMHFPTANFEDGRLPVQSVRTIARQLLLGLDFLHRECGVVHTALTCPLEACLKPTNILLELGQPDSIINQYLSEVPPRIGYEGDAPVPLREVITTPLLSEMKEPRIQIIDFGVASWRNKHLSELIQSPALRVPEVTIGAPWDTQVDIWSLGCLLVEFVQGFVLFSSTASKNGTWTAEDDQLARMMEILGPFPSHLERLINGTTKPFIKPADMSDAEVPVFIDFIRGMLQIDPQLRKSAADLLGHGWLKL
ncbi:protein kinase [Aspergillus sclerotioniger CBS 115572]|uniref:non-specific serine/threonine protein kinase n=1 Tax=Aspergillus sclerotioniger CBS 115572 TaxID=1450535 RepID=A0A317W976_9EURO|nr:protein kinase [Aspergillus sclerotioniger CBS 115572]PWY81558.1 protein kinase [Aspergillus sclerotioniger CBS 115572]